MRHHHRGHGIDRRLLDTDLLKYREPFKPEVFAREEEKMKRKKLARLQNLATSLNYQLIPNQ